MLEELNTQHPSGSGLKGDELVSSKIQPIKYPLENVDPSGSNMRIDELTYQSQPR